MKNIMGMYVLTSLSDFLSVFAFLGDFMLVLGGLEIELDSESDLQVMVSVAIQSVLQEDDGLNVGCRAFSLRHFLMNDRIISSRC